MTEAEMAVNAVKAQAVQGDKALAMADLIQTAVTLLRRGEALYPFNGLQGFPQNYPMLVTGDAQVRGGGDEPLRSAASILVPPDLCPSPSHPVPSPCPHPPTHTQSNAVRGSSVTVLANATDQVARHADVERAVLSAGHHVDGVHRALTARPIP